MTTNRRRTRRIRQPDPRIVAIVGEEHADVFCFLDLLAELFGTREDAAAAFIRSSPEFRLWLRRVRFCQDCQRYVPTKRYLTPPEWPNYTGYDYHRVPNPNEPPPHYVQCPGTRKKITQGPGRRIPADTLNKWRAKIKHQIKQVQPDLL